VIGGATPAAEPAGSDCPGEPAVAEPSDHAIGRSRGGLTTKVHALTDGRGRTLVMLLTAGNVNDTTMFAPLLAALRVARTGPGRPRTCPDYLVADKGYSSRANRKLLRRRGIAHTIAQPGDQAANRRRKGSAGGRPVGFDKHATHAATSSNAASARSNSGAVWPPATTSTPATTPAP
jgi:transposase